MNPFPIVGYYSPDYFCDREKETQAIVQAIKQNRPLNLVSIRRIGKTSLIKNVFHQLDTNEYLPIFIDLEGTDSIKGFMTRFSTVLAGSLSKINQGWLQTFVKWASGIGASVSLDPISGLPTLDLSHQSKSSIHSLDSLLSQLNEYKKKTIVIAIDEFQEITRYEDQNTEGWLRSVMQAYPEIRFIFSGSEKSTMSYIFNDPSRPFFQITQPMHLGYIDKDIYKNFIFQKLADWQDRISGHDILDLLDWCRAHTYYVQYTCNILYEKLSTDQFEGLAQLKKEIIESQKHFFLAQQKLLTSIQWKTLKAIAKRDAVSNFTSSEFLQFSGLAATSSRRSVESLLEKDVLLEENGEVKVYNVFFSNYLKGLE